MFNQPFQMRFTTIGRYDDNKKNGFRYVPHLFAIRNRRRTLFKI